MTDIPLPQPHRSMAPAGGRDVANYPVSLRLFHWTRAMLVLGMLGVGWLMTTLGDRVPMKYGTLYPLHKSFGLLLFALVMIQIAIRLRTTPLSSASGVAPREKHLSKLVHTVMYLLLVAVPLMGLIGLHVAGVLKHRYFDKRPGSDVLPRML